MTSRQKAKYHRQATDVFNESPQQENVLNDVEHQIRDVSRQVNVADDEPVKIVRAQSFKRTPQGLVSHEQIRSQDHVDSPRTDASGRFRVDNTPLTRESGTIQSQTSSSGKIRQQRAYSRSHTHQISSSVSSSEPLEVQKQRGCLELPVHPILRQRSVSPSHRARQESVRFPASLHSNEDGSDGEPSFGDANCPNSTSKLRQKLSRLEDESLTAADEEQIYRVKIVGSSDVGKSSLCQQFAASEHLGGGYSESTHEEDEDDSSVVVSINVDGQEVNILFGDHEGELSSTILSSLHACLIVYAIDDGYSYQHAVQCLKSIRKHDRNLLIFMVANKSDLVRSRETDSEEGQKVAERLRARHYEVSTVLNHNVDDLLLALVADLRSLYEDESLSNNSRLSTGGQSKVSSASSRSSQRYNQRRGSLLRSTANQGQTLIKTSAGKISRFFKRQFQ